MAKHISHRVFLAKSLGAYWLCALAFFHFIHSAYLQTTISKSFGFFLESKLFAFGYFILFALEPIAKLPHLLTGFGRAGSKKQYRDHVSHKPLYSMGIS